MEKIIVEICTGTACYVVGGAELLTIEDYFSEDELRMIQVKGLSCLKLCNGDNPATPYAVVDGKIIEKATVELLAEEVRKAIELKYQE